MSICRSGVIPNNRSFAANDFGRSILWLLWQCIRVPLFLLLATLQPVITFVLGALAFLGVLTACFWKLVGPPQFPFGLVLGVSLSLALARILYHKLLRWLSV